jgi:acyl-CoA synthetase (AMP-forming)/AMP-acid ligase II
MNLTALLDMAASAMGDRILIGDRTSGLTAQSLRDKAIAGAAVVKKSNARVLAFHGGNDSAFPIALFSAAYAGIPFLPLNYRLSVEQLTEILAKQDAPMLLSNDSTLVGASDMLISDFLATIEHNEHDEPTPTDSDGVAVLLMTSGTTAAPKSAILRHRNLTSYILASVDFASAEPDDATIVSVPPYHIAAVANLLSNSFAGRRIVYLDHFTAESWIDTVESQGITNAMVVPTMLARIVRELDARGTNGPSALRSISYGGAKVSPTVLRRAIDLFPGTDFVNAYGLTETASSIAILGPEDHRTAVSSDDPIVAARLGSVGRALPGVTIEIHDDFGVPSPANTVGNIVVKGPQIAGEYREAGSLVDANGWFHTRDLGYIDDEGFVYVQGRADDTIIRGGENIAPAEIEDVLHRHEAIHEAVVAGVPDEEWGQAIAAFVVAMPDSSIDEDAVKQWTRLHLRSSKTPDRVYFVDEVPTTPTGKILRRVLVDGVTLQQAP